MGTRRNFIKSAALGSLALGMKKVNAGNAITEKRNAPVVISTWDFGQKANDEAWKILEKGGSSLDAVESGARVPEADPTNQTIGYGGLPDRDGVVTLDACIMDHQFNCGSVMCLENIMHPVSVARLVMEKTPHIILVGEGALQFALANGFEKTNLLTPESEKAWKEWLKDSRYQPEKNIENRLHGPQAEPVQGDQHNHDTIGVLGMDASGNLSGACTTSGLAFKMHGRVGDSPVIGAGLYVDNEAGAATSSGVGEEVIRVAGAHMVVSYMRAGLSPEAACRKAVERIVGINPEKSKSIQVGFLALSRNGTYGGYSIQPGFTYAVRDRGTNRIFPAKSYYK